MECNIGNYHKDASFDQMLNTDELDLKKAKSHCFQNNDLSNSNILELKGRIISEENLNSKPKPNVKNSKSKSEIIAKLEFVQKKEINTLPEMAENSIHPKISVLPSMIMDPENFEETNCPFCDKTFTLIEIWEHAAICESQVSNVSEYKTEVKTEVIKTNDDLIIQCKYCADWFGSLDMEEHLLICGFKYDAEDLQKEKEKEPAKDIIKTDIIIPDFFYKDEKKITTKTYEEIKTCASCNEVFGFLDFEDHSKTCIKEIALKTCTVCKDLFGFLDFEEHSKTCKKELALKTCTVCNDVFGFLDFEEHSKTCKKKKIVNKPVYSGNNLNSIHCPVCSIILELDELDEHICLDSNIKKNEIVADIQKEEPLIKKCRFCKEEFATGDLVEHEFKCEEFIKTMIESEKQMINCSRKMLLEDNLVTEMQLQAIQFVQDESEKKSVEARLLLLGRFKTNLGYGEYELEKTLEWIRSQAPIIVHFHPEKVMKFFVKDTHYRNQFETGTSSGTLSRPTRIGWEDKIFNSIYHDSSDFDRVKYGVLNIVNDPNGVQCCRAYGDSYFVLNNDTIRLRTTFASGDTSGSVELATCEHYCHVLNTFSDKELKDVISVATRKRFCVSSKNISVYKEIQIHGELRFDRDISAMILNTNHLSNPELIIQAEEFSRNNNFNLVWMDS